VSRDTAVRLALKESEVESAEPKPLTERTLCRLPGPRLLWLGVWVLVPWMNAAVTVLLQASDHLPSWESPTLQLLTRAAFSIAILLSVGGGQDHPKTRFSPVEALRAHRGTR
jgi:hypothetical protein